MSAWIFGRLRCLIGKHERSKRHARKRNGEEQYTTICAFCRVPMRQRGNKDWVVDKPSPPPRG